MSHLNEDQELRTKLWKQRMLIFLVFIALTAYWIFLLSIPYLKMSGSGQKAQFFPLAFVLPFFGIVAALSSLTKFSPIYKTTKEDLPLIVLFALVFLLFPIYAHLHEIQKLVIADAIWTPAWITSLGLAIASGLIFFVHLRKNHILLGIPIMMGLFATSIGALLGAIIFKLLSLAFS